MNEWGLHFVPETREQVQERVIKALIEVEANRIAEQYTFKSHPTGKMVCRWEDVSWPSM